MEQPLKERLVGAIVLVVAAVLFVPMLLDGAGRGDTETTELDLKPEPAPASPIRVRTIHLDEPEVAEADPTTAQQEQPVVEPEPMAPEENAEESAVPDEAPASAPGWAVQVGSFASEINAERLAAELRERGYPAFVAPSLIDGRSMHRVRVGPEPNRDRAESLAERLRRDGQRGKVVEHP